MAITRVGFNSGNTDNTSSVVINKPTGTIDGDVLVLFVSCDGTSGFNTPTGFTLQSTQQTLNTHTNQIFTRVANSEPSNYTFNPASNERAWVCLTTYRGADNTTPIDSVNNSSTGASGTDATIPSFTPTVDDCLVIAFVGHANGNSGAGIMGTWPSPLVEVIDNVNGPPGTGNASSAGAYAEVLQTTKTAVSGTAVNSDESDWGVIIFALTPGEPPVIGIDTAPSLVDAGDTNLALEGFGFEATQGTGKVEVINNAEYASATIKVTQSIDSWSDTDIQFDFSKGTLSNGIVWIVVTNDNGDVSVPKSSFLGTKPYYDEVKGLTNPPDIYHRFNNNYNDEQGTFTADGQASSGSFGFVATPITKDNTHAWKVNDDNSRIEMADSEWTNVTNLHTQRCIAGWVQFGDVYKVPSGIWEEGGGVNNLYLIVGFGNIVLANVADSGGSPAFKVQRISTFKLSKDRPYHLTMKVIFGTSFKFFIDGVEQDLEAGDLGTDTTMSTHSGDYAYGKPDSTLDTGGTDIQYPSGPDLMYSDWMTFSEAGNGLPTDLEIREILFELGAIATDEIDSDTEVNMQSDIDLLADTAYVDKPLPLKINRKDGGGNLALSLDNVTFDDRCSMHIQFLGKTGETLTITNTNGSNCDLTMCSTPYGGTIVVINPYTITVTGMAEGTKIRIFKSSDFSLIASVNQSSGDFQFSTLESLIDVIITDEDYKPVVKRSVSITGDTIIPVVQDEDIGFIGPDNPN